MYEEIVLDCTMLESPEPLNLVVQNLDKIDEKTYIKMIHRIEPAILYGILTENGYEYQVKNKDKEIYIYIYKGSLIEEHLKCMQD